MGDGITVVGVANAQVIKVALNDIRDSAGGRSNTFAASMGLLLGDTIQVRSQSGNDITSSNFRMDLDTDGLFNVGDTAIARAQSGTALPAQTGSRPAKPLLKIGIPGFADSRN